MNGLGRIAGFLAIPVIALLMFWLAESRPGYFTNVNYLGGLLLLEILIVTTWHYEKTFFAVMLFSFLWAGSNLPLAGAGEAVRWIFLTAGAAAGVIKWAERERRQQFGPLHLIALLCVLSATVSAMESSRGLLSILKAGSLALLFLFASCGARVSVAGRENAFFRGVLAASEIVTYISGLCYLVLHFGLFGNPNSLGAIAGVALVPLLLWGMLIAEDSYLRQRRAIALCLAVYLLLSSVSRAGILAGALTFVIACVAARRQRLLMKGAFFLVLLVATIAVLQPDRVDTLMSSFTEDVVYKGKRDQGLLGSRKSPWQETADVIRESPWFGSGFGTDRIIGGKPTASLVYNSEGAVKEHGNSYLALLQYVGLVGVVPFTILLVTVLRLILHVLLWVRRTADVRNYAFPLALLCFSGLVHAFFEDWLFAVGYYLTLLFWSSVFVLYDLRPVPRSQPATVLPWTARVSRAGRIPLSANR